jgi:hypothetical protein
VYLPRARPACPVELIRSNWGERTFRAISDGFRELSRLQQGFAALGISGDPPNRKPMIFWLLS